MSRIGRAPIAVPAGVEIKVAGNHISVKGPKGALEMDHHPDMIVKVDGNVVTVERPSDNKEHRSLHGLTRTLIANMIHGVHEEFSKTLEVNGVGYRAQGGHPRARQAKGGPVCRRGAREAPAGALQGQGHQI